MGQEEAGGRSGFGLSASGWDKLDQKAMIDHAVDKASMLIEADNAEHLAIENTEIIFDAEATAALMSGTCGPAVELDGDGQQQRVTRRHLEALYRH